ncbi:hypothetical protein [Methylobacterium sp. J-076]|uniref:hypothetical protein n=1 Tax=Methylobacterium sp. J-076 TaxID=2836655 RepID=UPI001FBA8C2B|nr:hypothetical protein [Methylobacterium sp. J-076]MCJ2011589.1 hypothetical protein [Methylobacterium sp. J-076]
MALFHWIGRVLKGAERLAAAAFIGVVTLFAASLDFALGIVTRLYDRFDAGFSDLAAQSRQRRTAKGEVAAPR